MRELPRRSPRHFGCKQASERCIPGVLISSMEVGPPTVEVAQVDRQDRHEQWAVFWCSLPGPLFAGLVPSEEARSFPRKVAETEYEFLDGRRRKPSTSSVMGRRPRLMSVKYRLGNPACAAICCCVTPGQPGFPRVRRADFAPLPPGWNRRLLQPFYRLPAGLVRPGLDTLEILHIIQHK